MFSQLNHLASDARKKGNNVILFIAMEGWQKKGGQGDYVRELSDALSRAGNMVLVVGPYYQQPCADILEEAGKHLFDIEIPVGGGFLALGIYVNDIDGVY